MGLDITAYSNLKSIGRHVEFGEWCEDDDHITAYAYDSFPRSFRGIEVLGEHDHLLHGGCFIETEATETIGFRAGSYGGYNAWRQDLADQFNPVECQIEGGRPSMTEPDPDKPFYELIWFADNEGSIGPEAAKDLLEDFQTHAAAYIRPDLYEWYPHVYANWTRAFELAADGGLVRFH
jgi:hypothetical protein